MRNTEIHGTSPMKSGEHFTYADYRKWPEDERWELIKGAPYAMSPAPQWRHQTLSGQLYAQLDAFFLGKPCRPNIAPVDVFLPETDETLSEIDTVVQPDLLVVCDRKKIIDEGVHGAPDFILEILSPGTALKDQSEKRDLYERHGVREYWIVNPNTLETFVYLLEKSTYGLPKVASLRVPVPVVLFPGLELKAREEDL